MSVIGCTVATRRRPHFSVDQRIPSSTLVTLKAASSFTVTREPSALVMCASYVAPSASFSLRGGPLVSAGAIALSVWLVSNSPWTEVRLAAVFVVAGVALYFAYNV